jgi:KaiC/GvpD/RAD55 family RecA-like ATPase
MHISLIDGGLEKFRPVYIDSTKDLLSIITSETYSLGVFDNNYRSNGTFKGSYYVGLDFDAGMSLNEAKLKFAKYEHIIAISKSHQKEKITGTGVVKPPCDRFRVILKCNSFIDNEKDFKATVTKLMEIYPDADPQCKDAARYFYSSPEIISYRLDGEKIPLVKYVKPEKKVDVSPNTKGELSRRTMDFLLNTPESKTNPGSLSNKRLFAAAVDMNEQGYTEQEAIDKIQAASINKYGELSENDLKTIGSGFNREPKYDKRIEQNCFKFKHPTELTRDEKDIQWLVDKLLIAGGISIFAGAPKSGKSTLTRQLAISICKGVPFLGRQVKKGKVLYLALEEQEELLGVQLKNLGLHKNDDIMIHIGPIAHGNVNDSLKAAIESYDADLVVIDTLLLLACFENPNDYNETYKVVSNLRNIARETGAHLILIHHKNKNEESTGANSVLGSTALQGAVDSTILLNNIRGREFYRKLNTFQRGGQRFLDQVIKYIPDKDIYELSKDKETEF